MSRRSLSILLVLLAAIAGGVVWLVGTLAIDAEPAAEASAAVPPPDRAESGAAAPDPSLADASASTTPALAGIESDFAAAARETIEKEPGDDETVDMTETWTVEGRVELPPGTPAGERVQVLAGVGSPRQPKIHSRADLGPDGSFRVAFSKSAEKGHLALEARFLYLPEVHEVSPEALAKSTSPIILRPEIGGCIHGNIVLARNALDHRDSIPGTEVNLNARSQSDQRDWSNQIHRKKEVDGSLEFEFGGLPVGLQYQLDCHPKDLVDAVAEDLKVERGRVLPVDLDVRLGARVTGRVVDEKGAPVEGVEIGLETQRGMHHSWGGTGQNSAAAGTFTLAGIRPSKVALRFTGTGYTLLRSELGELADGDVRTGIEAVLHRGQSVTGRILWPDGSGAKDARIEYRFAREEGSGENRYFDNETDIVFSGDDGTFEISGLGPQPIVVTAAAKFPGEEEAGSGEARASASAGSSSTSSSKASRSASGLNAGSARDRKREALKTKWKAHLEGIAPGTRDLVVTLQEGATVRGRAVDDLKAPIRAFHVRAEPEDGSEPWERSRRGITSSGKDGEFTIEGLYPGEWNLIGEAKLHAPSSARRIRVPGDTEIVELELPRAAKVAGIVVDGAGMPVPRAKATADSADAASRFDWNRKGKSDVCDAEGRFEIEGVPPGPVKVTATAEGMAGSAAVALELTPAQVVTDLSLALRRPARITGEVVDDAGRPMPGRPIFANGMEDQSNRNLKSDDAGRFEIDGLTPGQYWINSQPSEEELAKASPEESESSTFWMKHQKSASVRLSEGETVHVVLGGAVKDGVRVHGIVYAGSKRDRTVADCTLWMQKKDSTDHSPITGTSDAEGRYEVDLPGAGEYVVSVMNQARGTTTSTRFTVPEDEKSFEHDIVIPGGRIAGRVIGVDGKPVVNVQVSCAPERMTAAFSGEASYGHSSTDASGAFAFDGMHAGTYRLEAGMQDWQNAPAGSGKCVRGGVVLAPGESIEGLELRLQKGCRVEGLVLGPEGRPAAGATVHARDESGNLLQQWPLTSADASGRFVMEKLPAGRATFAARTKKLASLESAPVVLSPDETARVELALRPGTRLRVIVRDKDDRVVGSFVAIEDASGRDVTQMYAFNEPQFLGQSSEGEGQLLGPVPPGRYRLTATNHDRISASGEVSVSGQEEEVVTLKFGG